MFESRCGIECSKCEYAKEVNCKGCVNLEKPFWGECPVKKCCEEKKLENCGLCTTFPCKILLDFAYDAENGDNGKRIETCKGWCANRSMR